MDLVGPILDIVKCIADPGCKYVDYHRKLEDNMDELRKKLRDLNSRKGDVESRIEAELQWGTELKNEVQDWLEDVRKVNRKGELVEQTVTVVSCFCRAKVGKKVCNLIDEVKEVYQRGTSFLEGVVIRKSQTTGVTIPTTNMEGEIDVKEKIWEYLMGDNVGMIGVCGMGGIGKTTIMKHINNQLLYEATFKKVIWITVSKEFNVAKVQDEIAHGMNKVLPHYELERVAALTDILSTQRRYVLILDDVWEAFSLEDVGIPKSAFCNGNKLVLTSRSIEVCKSIGCEIVKVQPLSEEESLNLFIDKAGCDALRDPDPSRIVKLIVEECAGLPLAIVTVAGSMKGVEDIREWRNALNELREHVRGVKGQDLEIFERLKFSFDRLKDPKLQNCFLYCALYPEDFEIPRDELIEYWIVEGLIDEFESRQEMHDRGHSILNRLENNCLLEREFVGKFVKMHDVVRDMALHIKSSGSRYVVKAGLGLREMTSVMQQINDVEKLSLMKNGISEIPPSVCPSGEILSTLFLQRNHNLKGIPSSFFKQMPLLTVLDLSYAQIEELPDSISNLENLTALLLLQCDKLRYVPSLAKLKLLQKLDLFLTDIEEVPQGMQNLVNLRYLEIYSRLLMELPTGILPELTHLQHLVLGSDSPSAKINVPELIGLKKLETFAGYFHDMQDFKDYLKSIQDGGPSNYELRVGYRLGHFQMTHQPCNVFPLGNRTRHISGKEVHFWKCDVGEQGSLVLPHDLQFLEMLRCNNLRSLSLFFRRPTDLKHCYVKNSDEIECVLDLSSSSSYSNLFHNLEELTVCSSQNLCALVKLGAVSVCTSSAPAPPAIFPNLKNLVLDGCCGIKKLFPVDLVQDLKNLEVIIILYCAEMEEIIASGEETQETIIFTFPKLRLLRLYGLPKLMSICTSNGTLACDSIEEIDIKRCQNLKRIPLILPLSENGQPSRPLSLKNLYIDSREHWESFTWDNPDAKNIFLPFLKIDDREL